jgi:hypothetical protein
MARLRFLEPEDFPEFLMTDVLPTVDDEGYYDQRRDPGVAEGWILGATKDRPGRLRPGYFEWLAAPYMLVARGMHGIPYAEADRVEELLLARRTDYHSVSLNVYAAAEFARPFPGPSFDWDMPRAAPEAEAVMSSMLLLKLLPQHIVGFGGDSESGILQEAELHVRQCDECVAALFLGGSRRALRLLRPVPETVRQRYGLSAFCRIEPMRSRAADWVRHWNRRRSRYVEPKQLRVVTTPRQHADIAASDYRVPSDWTWFAWKGERRWLG